MSCDDELRNWKFVCCRSKQEDDERRKAEEKARRDAIFEKYIKRKMAVEGHVENEVAAPASGSQPVRSTPPLSHVVMRRKPTPGRTPSARPMSQPPPPHAGPLPSATETLVFRSSDENLTDGSQPSCISHSKYCLSYCLCTFVLTLSARVMIVSYGFSLLFLYSSLSSYL